MAGSPWLDVREWFAAKLVAATTVALGGDKVFWRPRRAEVEIPSVTYLDFRDRPDATVPLYIATFQVDTWAKTRVQAEELAAAIEGGLDGAPGGFLAGARANVVECTLVSSVDASDEDNDVFRVRMGFRVQAYRLVRPT